MDFEVQTQLVPYIQEVVSIVVHLFYCVIQIFQV